MSEIAGLFAREPYFEALCAAMRWLSELPNTVFVGQGVGVPGTTMSDTFRDVAQDKCVEFPVAEDMQLGFCTGLSLTGYLPICVFPRWNFMLCAMNQLVNHLDRMSLYSDDGYRPKVIIRVATPSSYPFNPGPQHDDDLSDGLAFMLRTIDIFHMKQPAAVMECYQHAVVSNRSAIMVEYTDLYRNARAE